MGEQRLHGLLLDGLLPDTTLEREVASGLGATLVAWDGERASLERADFVLHVRTAVDREMIDALPRCRAIGRFGTGLDSVDTELAERRGIAVVAVRDYATDEVADHALALALAVSRGLGLPVAPTVASAWADLDAGPAIAVDGPVGILGLGTIGLAAAARFARLGLPVIGWSRHTDGKELPGWLEVVDLDDLFAQARIVSLHLALTPETRHILDAERLAALRPDAILVNTARAGLVDARALIAALTERRLRGAGLDAFEGEEGAWLWNALRSTPCNALATPHIGWYSPASVRRLRSAAVTSTVAAVHAAIANPREGTVPDDR